MPDLDQTGSHDIEVDQPGEAAFDPSEIGQNCAFDFLPEPHYLSDGQVWIPDEYEDDGLRDTSPLSDSAKQSLMELDMKFAKCDVAPRRIEIEQVWKSRHYDRGYQFLLHNKNGGWTMPGTGTNYGAWNQQLMSNMYATNIYGEKKEIIQAALSRQVPNVEFFPLNPEWGPDNDMAEVAPDLKEIWAKNNNLQGLLRDVAGYFWTDDRVLLWTRFELNGDEYGYEEDEQPVSIEDALMPGLQPTAQDADQQYQIMNQSPLGGKRPRGRVITTAEGKLEHKIPIYVDNVNQAHAVSIYQDKDTSVGRAMFPWMKSKIKGGGDGTGETELDRIARENVRQAVPGQYVTGDSINSHVVIKHSYLRRTAFYDENVKDEVREELLGKFPDGVKMVKAATEFCYARNECIDDHVEVGHPFPGSGQNRRAMGDSLLPIQDYINELVSLSLDFAKRTIPKKWYDTDAFNVEAMKTQTNIPGASGGFQTQPGRSVDQLVFVEPTPTPQPWLVSYVQWMITSLSEQISGALPSLFGAQISGQVGSEGVAMQRDQALQRVGCPWNAIQGMFSRAGRQAVMLTAKCANKDINDVIPGKGRVSVKLNKLKGNVLCFPEASPEFPETASQKESRIMSLVDAAMSAPSTEFSQLILSPKNLKPIKDAIRVREFKITGADSVEKQEGELEVLLRSGPMPNPQKMMAQAALEQAQAGIQQTKMKVLVGAATPEEIQQATVGTQMVQQLQQAIQSMPDEISTVPVRQDDSENHSVEADVIFDWANGPNGRKFSNGTPEQKAAFANALLHRTEHKTVEKKLAAENAPPAAPPKVSFSANIKDMPPTEAAEVMTAGGIPAQPDDFNQMHQVKLNTDIAKKVVPKTIDNSQKPEPAPPEPGGPPGSDSKPPRKLRK